MSVASAASYAVNQCTWFVARTLSWIPAGLGNAGDWLANAARQGYPESSSPVVGSVAVWGRNMGGASSVGHVAVVTGIGAGGLPIVAEENWPEGSGPRYGVQVTPQQASGIIGYILPKGSGTGTGIANLGGSPAGSGIAAPASLDPTTWPGAIADGLTGFAWRVLAIWIGAALIILGMVVLFWPQHDQLTKIVGKVGAAAEAA